MGLDPIAFPPNVFSSSPWNGSSPNTHNVNSEPPPAPPPIRQLGEVKKKARLHAILPDAGLRLNEPGNAYKQQNQEAAIRKR